MSSENQRIKPFSQEYVIRTTARHMLRSVQLSIDKTMERMPEFAGDPQKSGEVFTTLTRLHAIKKQIESFHNSIPGEIK